MKIIPWWKMRMVCEYGDWGGEGITIGSLNMKGLKGIYVLQEKTLNSIYRKRFFFLSQVINNIRHYCPIWKSASEMGLPHVVENNWRQYANILSQTTLFHNIQGDIITWGGKMHN